jgi:hypothetical protein
MRFHSKFLNKKNMKNNTILFWILSPNKYLYLKFLRGCNFDGSLDMKVKTVAMWMQSSNQHEDEP